MRHLRPNLAWRFARKAGSRRRPFHYFLYPCLLGLLGTFSTSQAGPTPTSSSPASPNQAAPKAASNAGSKVAISATPKPAPATSLAASQIDESNGEKSMLTLLETLHALEADDLNALQDVADSLRIRAYADPQTVVTIVNGKDAVMAKKGRLLLGLLGPLAIEPQLENPGKENALQYSETLQRLVDTQNQIRSQLAHELTAALNDKRELPPPHLRGKIEGRIPSQRVCDKAYLLLRQFLLVDETVEKQSHQARLFLDLNDKSRDLEIEKFKHHKAFTQMEDLFPGE